MEEMTKPISPILEDMQVGEVEQWPVERYESVRVTANRVNIRKRRSGYHLKVAIKGLTVEVTREA